MDGASAYHVRHGAVRWWRRQVASAYAITAHDHGASLPSLPLNWAESAAECLVPNKDMAHLNHDVQPSAYHHGDQDRQIRR